MLINKKKINFYILVIFIAFIFMLTGCTKKGKNENEIISDLQFRSDFLSSENVMIEDLSINKRKTKKEVDTVYVKVKTFNENYNYISFYELVYVLDNNDEWTLDEINPYDKEEWRVFPRFYPEQEVNEYMNQRFSDYSESGGSFDDHGNAFYGYKVSINDPYLNYEGRIHVHFEFNQKKLQWEYKKTGIDEQYSVNWNLKGKWYPDSNDNYYKEYADRIIIIEDTEQADSKHILIQNTEGKTYFDEDIVLNSENYEEGTKIKVGKDEYICILSDRVYLTNTVTSCTFLR